MEHRREDKLTEAGAGSREAGSEAKSAVKIQLYDVPGWEVHQTKPQASEQAHGEVEHHDVGDLDQLDVDGGREETRGGDGDPQQSDCSVAVLVGEGSHQGAGSEYKEYLRNNECKGNGKKRTQSCDI